MKSWAWLKHIKNTLSQLVYRRILNREHLRRCVVELRNFPTNVPACLGHSKNSFLHSIYWCVLNREHVRLWLRLQKLSKNLRYPRSLWGKRIVFSVWLKDFPENTFSGFTCLTPRPIRHLPYRQLYCIVIFLVRHIFCKDGTVPSRHCFYFGTGTVSDRSWYDKRWNLTKIKERM